MMNLALSYFWLRIFFWWHLADCRFFILAVLEIRGGLDELGRPRTTSTEAYLQEPSTDQYACFRHCLSSLTTLTISPLSLLSRPSNANISTTTYPPRLIQIWERNREGNSTSCCSFTDGSSTEYKLFPSAFLTRAIACPSSKTVGGVEVSAAVASRLRFGRTISAWFKVGSTAARKRCAKNPFEEGEPAVFLGTGIPPPMCPTIPQMAVNSSLPHLLSNRLE